MIGLRLDRLDPRVVQVLNLVAVAGSAATLPVLVDASGLRGRRPARRHRRRRRRRAARRGRRRPARRPARADRPGDPQPASAAPGASTCTGASPAPSSTSSDRQSSPAMLAHHLFEAGSLVDRETRIAAGLRRRPALGRGRRLRGRRVVDRPRRRRSSPTRSALASGSSWSCCGATSPARQGDRAGAIAAAREAADVGRRDGRPDAARRRRRGLDDVAVGRRLRHRHARPTATLVELMERAIAELPPDQRRYQVRMRSMLTSVLVPEPDTARRVELADEAMAIAEASGESELLASALLARRLALVAARSPRRADRRGARLPSATPTRPATCSSS